MNSLQSRNMRVLMNTESAGVRERESRSPPPSNEQRVSSRMDGSINSRGHVSEAEQSVLGSLKEETVWSEIMRVLPGGLYMVAPLFCRQCLESEMWWRGAARLLLSCSEYNARLAHWGSSVWVLLLLSASFYSSQTDQPVTQSYSNTILLLFGHVTLEITK